MFPACRHFPSPFRYLGRFSVLSPSVASAASAATASTSAASSSLRLPAASTCLPKFVLRRAQLSTGAFPPENKEEQRSCGDVSSPAYHWAKVYCNRDVADALSEALLCFGASSVSMDKLANYEASNKICITSVFIKGRDVKECISVAADSVGLKKLPTYEITSGEDNDWTKNALENFYPTEITSGLWIVPQWRKAPEKEAINIILNPGLAFGTGEHPTTKLCLLLLYGLVKGGECFLDYGTGSGILGIAAVKMGAALSVGVDVDPQAISAAEQNILLNNLQPNEMALYLISEKIIRVQSDEKTDNSTDASSLSELKLSSRRREFDIVIANILMNPLMEMADDIASYAKPGATIGLSGILSDQVLQIKNHYSQYLDDISVSELEGWACLSGKKKS